MSSQAGIPLPRGNLAGAILARAATFLAGSPLEGSQAAVAPAAAAPAAAVPAATVPAAAAPSRTRGPNLFDLPRGVRDEIFRLALFDDAPEVDMDQRTEAWSPNQLGLLCASRQVYKEAAAVMNETVYLGSDPPSALRYLEFMGGNRIRQIRNLVIFYQCFEECGTEYADAVLNWMPVFELLRRSRASVRRVKVWSQFCALRVERFGNCQRAGYENYLAGKCLLLRGEEHDKFFRGLRTLTMAEHIDFVKPWAVPEYLVHIHERDLGWVAEGRRLGDYRDSSAYPEFEGKVVNPTYPHEFDWLQYVHKLIEEGIDVSGMQYGPEDNSWRTEEEGTSTVLTPPRQKKNLLLELPLEIRKTIYDFACDTWEDRLYWPTRPSRWNAGIGLLSTCKQIHKEALPSVYRNFRIYGSYADKTLAWLGPRIDLVQNLTLHVTCFCPCQHDVNFSGTTYHRENGPFFPPDIEGDQFFAESLDLSNPSSDTVTTARQKAMLTTTMALINSKPTIQTLRITLASCARYKPRLYNGNRHRDTDALTRPACLALENHFLSLLLHQTHHIERLTLDGDIPPSFALRMQERQRGEGVLKGPELRIRYVGRKMRKFMRMTCAHRARWERWQAENQSSLSSSSSAAAAAERGEWEKPVHFPHVTYPTPEPVTHFVLVAGGTAKGRLERVLEGMERVVVEAKGESGMGLVGGKVEGRTWEGLSGLLDYENEVRKRMPGESGVGDDWELLGPVEPGDQGWGDGPAAGVNEQGFPTWAGWEDESEEEETDELAGESEGSSTGELEEPSR
jgi:hypothetical protein